MATAIGSVPARLPAVMLRRSVSSRRALQVTAVERSWLTVEVSRAAKPKDPVATMALLLRVEGEDAKMTGGTRSLMRRTLALNVEGRLPPQGSRQA